MKFPTPPEPEKVKSETGNTMQSLQNIPDTVVDTKEREDKENPPASLSPVALQRLGLTPGSHVWKLLLGIDDSSQQTPET